MGSVLPGLDNDQRQRTGEKFSFATTTTTVVRRSRWEVVSIWLVSGSLSTPVCVVGLLALRSIHCLSPALSSRAPFISDFSGRVDQ